MRCRRAIAFTTQSAEGRHQLGATVLVKLDPAPQPVLTYGGRHGPADVLCGARARPGGTAVSSLERGHWEADDGNADGAGTDADVPPREAMESALSECETLRRTLAPPHPPPRYAIFRILHDRE